MLRTLIIWLIIFLATTTGYSFKEDLLNNKVVANLVPAQGHVLDNNTISFYRAQDGHFYIKSKINNRGIIFLADTGASDVAISIKDARKIGINTKELNFSKIYSTANGKIYVAPVTIPKMQIGPFVLTDVKAGISQGDIGVSLLGMSVLERFTVSLNNKVLTLTY
jgi:aspartyl protease family protein